METTTDYWAVRGDTLDEAVTKMQNYKKEQLIQLIINNRLNGFVSSYADNEEDKRIPYIGWYWRATDFAGKKISIGDCGEFIGVMENNKWDYPERLLSESEADQVLEIIWRAKKISEGGGELKEIRANTVAELEKLWPLFQTFKIEQD